MSTEIPCLDLRRVSRRFPSGGRTLTVVDAIDLVVPRGQTVAILGPSGSGKSTLLALMAGLDRPSEGEIYLQGAPMHRLSEDGLARLRRERVGFVFQSFHLLANMTALENVLLPVELKGEPDARDRARSLLGLVGLGDRLHHYPAQLSGGEQQRVALARAFAARPDVLLADEPTGNLDRNTGTVVLDLLDTLHRESGATLVVVTHDPRVAERAQRRVHLADGRIVRDEQRQPTEAVS